MYVWYVHFSVGVAKTKPPLLPGSHASSQPRPALGSQIVIHSEQEKQLKKLARKEETKIAKQVKDLQAAGVEDHETQLQLLGYDPELLRRER